MPVRSRSRRSRSTRNVAAIGVDRAQLVELCVVTRRDDAAVAHLRRRLGRDRASEQRVPLRIHAEIFGNRAQERRLRVRAAWSRSCGSDGERVAQSREVARARVAERDPRHDALDVDRAAQQRRSSARRASGAARSASIASWRAAAAVTSRSGCVSHSRSRRLPAARRAVVEQRQQRGRRLAGQRGGDLEIAPRCGIERDDKRPSSRRRGRARASAPPAASRPRSAEALRPRRWRAARRRRRMPRGPACRVAARALARPRPRRNATRAAREPASGRAARAPARRRRAAAPRARSARAWRTLRPRRRRSA